MKRTTPRKREQEREQEREGQQRTEEMRGLAFEAASLSLAAMRLARLASAAAGHGHSEKHAA